MKNMKIEINETQPLDEVVRGLERLGYMSGQFYFHISDHKNKDEFNSVACYENGSFYYHKQGVDMIWQCGTTTLAELKEMK